MPRVLVIDDDVQTCQVIGSALRERGHEVELAHDGREGLEKFRTSSFNLVICDIFLPEMMGYDVCASIQGSNRRVPVIAMSGICRSARDAEELGVPVYGEDFVAKPLDVAALQEKVARLLGATAQALAGMKGPFQEPAMPAADSDRERWVAELAGQIVELFCSRRSGLLRLKRGELSVDVSFANGFPVEVLVPFRRENVGLFLTRQGRLTEAQYERVLQRMIERRLPLEQLLVDDGLVPAEEMPALIRAHKREAIIGCFLWGFGQLQFTEGTIQADMGAQLNPSTLVLDGVARAFPGGALLRDYQARADEVVRPGPRFERSLTLFTPFLFRTGLHACFDGHHDVGAILERSEGDPETVGRLLKSLELVEVIEIVPRTAEVATELEPSPGPDIAEPGPAAPSPSVAPTVLIPDAPATDARNLWRELMALKDADHYALLGVAREAKPESIREAFLARMARYRPDRSDFPPDVVRLASEMLVRVAAAFGALSDPELRAVYDRRLGPAPIEKEKPEPSGEADLLFARGKAALEQLDFPVALEAFEEARRLNPEVAEYHLYTGLVRYHGKSHDPETIQVAVQEIQHAAEIDIECDLAYYHLGQIYKEQGLLNKARTMYARAFRINPKNVLARRALEGLGGVAA